MTTQIAFEGLDDVEQSRLRVKENVIERGAQQIGAALRDIRDERLYRETHSTFEAYCQERWDIGRNYANRQIQTAEVAALVPNGTNIREAHARELAPMRDDPDRMRAVWDAALEATDGNPTAAAIREARNPQTPEPAVSGEAPAGSGQASEGGSGDAAEVPDVAVVEPQQDATRPPVVGIDGKTYTRPAATKPSRRALTDVANDAGWDLQKAIERIQRVAADDRFTANAEQVTPHLRSHLTNAIEVCQDLLNRINNN